MCAGKVLLNYKRGRSFYAWVARQAILSTGWKRKGCYMLGVCLCSSHGDVGKPESRTFTPYKSFNSLYDVSPLLMRGKFIFAN